MGEVLYNVLDTFVLLYGVIIGVGLIIYLYFNITKNTKPVVGKCIGITTRKVLFVYHYFPVIEYCVEGTTYKTEYAFNPTMIKNKYKVGESYNIRYKIRKPGEAYHYNIFLFILIIFMCIVFTGFAYLLYTMD